MRKVCLLGLLSSALLLRQDYRRNTLTAGYVEAFRLGSNSYYIQTRPGISLGYGVRVKRMFQLDAGFEYILRAVGSSVCCRDGESAEDNLYLWSAGGRLVFEPRGRRWFMSIGGGGAYLQHSQRN